MSAVDEARFSPDIARFLQVFNQRVSPKVSAGTRWVRVRPADDEDFEMVREDSRMLPFVRPGAEALVTGIDSLFPSRS